MTTQINLNQNQLEILADALLIKEFTNSECLRKIESGELKKDPEFTMWLKATIEDTKRIRETMGCTLTNLLLKKNYNK